MPLIDELQPSLVIAMGKRASEILALSKRKAPPLVVWNRAQAATEAVLRERANSAAEVFSILKLQGSGPVEG
jgi:hypothetical protein